VRADALDAIDAVDAIGEAELYGFRAVGDRAAADGDDEVGIGLARRIGGGDHGLARRVRWHGVEYAGAAGTERLPDFRDLVGLPDQRAGDHQEGALRLDAIHLREDGRGCRPAEHNLLDRAVNDTSLVQGCPPQDNSLRQ
jgi:hypothetical protein